MIKERLCIHHNDSDGRLAGAMVKFKYPETKLIEVDYNNYKEKLKDLLSSETIPTYEEVYILDFSLKQNKMERLINKYTLIWCDHHKSAKEELEQIWNNQKVKGIRSIDKCGAMLTWNYFGNESFEELRLVDDYDRWIFKYGEKTHHFIELTKDWDTNQWSEAITKTGTGIMNKYISEGKNLFSLKLQRIEQLIKKGNPLSFKGKKALIVNNSNTMDGALLGNKICEQGYDIAIKFEFNKDKVIFGLNSIGNLDVSRIAKEYGGGGHKNASGFILSIPEFIDFLEDYCKKCIQMTNHGSKRCMKCLGKENNSKTPYILFKGTFMWAIEQMKKGKKVKRREWKKGRGIERRGYMDDSLIRTKDNNQFLDNTYLTINDFEAKNWEIYN